MIAFYSETGSKRHFSGNTIKNMSFYPKFLKLVKHLSSSIKFLCTDNKLTLPDDCWLLSCLQLFSVVAQSLPVLKTLVKVLSLLMPFYLKL